MADSSSQAPPTEQVENLHLDEVTGEKVRTSRDAGFLLLLLLPMHTPFPSYTPA